MVKVRWFFFGFVLFSAVILAEPIRVINHTTQTQSQIGVLENYLAVYCSSKDLANVLASQVFENSERQKLVLYIGDHRVKISANTSYIIVDERVFQMPAHAISNSGDLYLPAEAIFTILQTTILPGITYDSNRQLLDIALVEFNITGLAIDDKANGTILRIKTRKRFNDKFISTFSHKNGWFYVTVQEGIVDSSEIRKTDTRGIIKNVVVNQLGESAQLAFQLRSEIERHEFYQSVDPSEIVVTLRTPLSKSADRIKAIKSRWELDTVVLDAGHGGKDAGALGKNGTKEKDITLDIVKRVGRLLEKNTHIKVKYTRNEDVFVPLWKRTRIANEVNGKLFVSVHVNGNRNRSARGFETYLLKPGRNDDAIEVAARENGVIELEESREGLYPELTAENMIMATMAQSMFMKESEDLAGMVQKEMQHNLNSKNRGVKQAGFVVLVGASMPNVLVEVGFITNPTEEKNMRKPAYRQKIAEAIYRSIVTFKKSREFVLAEG
ncbi:MAG: N-acetylmuramoyl-L-alanine amidase [Candidatus Neomarinimicrobiota bacterium]